MNHQGQNRPYECPPVKVSQSVSPDGPVLLQDTALHETLENFVHDTSRPRAVHTKGWGAFGCFKTLRSMSAYTTACFLQNPGAVVPTLTRFSLAVSVRGTPDTSRNVRGFSTKFYTEEGTFDLLCNHLPVLTGRDEISRRHPLFTALYGKQPDRPVFLLALCGG